MVPHTHNYGLACLEDGALHRWRDVTRPVVAPWVFHLKLVRLSLSSLSFLSTCSRLFQLVKDLHQASACVPWGEHRHMQLRTACLPRLKEAARVAAEMWSMTNGKHDTRRASPTCCPPSITRRFQVYVSSPYVSRSRQR
jgi:hypothetical protein